MSIAVPVDLADAALSAEMAEDLAVVEAALRDTSFGGDEMFADVSRHMMEAGGKRFRAMLVLLAARFGDFRDKRLVPAAVAIELTHLATLFHDDVMDEAAIRRGHASANSRFGNSVAILAGDYLFARASRILSDLGPEAIRIQAETFGRLVDGQLLETVGVRPGEDPLDHYMHVITEKTGSLIATSGRFGAMFSGLPDETADLISDACLRIGVAWQLSDDVLDVASTSAESGKEQGTDLRQGVRTLPVLYALRGAAADADAVRLRELLTEADLTDPELHAEALTLLRKSPALEEARETVRTWVREARDLLAQLPDVPARAAFESLCDFVRTRTA
ncbi:polyprenyl synthetase family protein [Trebonia kvetii]|uniref:polyprenyl synthetase family protein n=1 Tax=Trebonia kvetii TaxID=2480626 RepID=UPI003F6E3AFB